MPGFFTSFLFRSLYFFRIGSLGFSGRLLPPDRRPQPIFPGDAARGKEIAEGQFTFRGISVFFDSEKGWQSGMKVSDEWYAGLYRFGWISDVRAFSDTRLSALHVRGHLAYWLGEDRSMRSVADHPEIRGERLANLSAALMFLLAGASGSFRRWLLRAMARDALAIHASLRMEETGLAAVKGLLFASLALPRAAYLFCAALNALPQALARETVSDGSHISRSPRLQAKFLQDLLEIQAALVRAEKPAVAALDRIIPAASSAFRLLLHGDGRLALFNDTLCGNPLLLARLSERAGNERIESGNIRTGFYRLARGENRIILDGGTPNPQHSATHFGTLSFEFSVGRHRLVTNCGAYRGTDTQWRTVCRTTPAHSTLILNRIDSYPRTPFSAQRIAPLVEAAYGERQHCPFVEARYNGYAGMFGLVHQRSLVLSEDGEELRGIDLLYPADGEAGHTAQQHAETRFHLHPAVQVEMLEGSSIALFLPNRERWVFSASRPAIIEESIYLGEKGVPAPARQIYISYITESPETMTEWTFARSQEVIKQLL